MSIMPILRWGWHIPVYPSARADVRRLMKLSKVLACLLAVFAASVHGQDDSDSLLPGALQQQHSDSSNSKQPFTLATSQLVAQAGWARLLERSRSQTVQSAGLKCSAGHIECSGFTTYLLQASLPLQNLKLSWI